jgi:hypothetical protein
VVRSANGDVTLADLVLSGRVERKGFLRAKALQMMQHRCISPETLYYAMVSSSLIIGLNRTVNLSDGNFGATSWPGGRPLSSLNVSSYVVPERSTGIGIVICDDVFVGIGQYVSFSIDTFGMCHVHIPPTSALHIRNEPEASRYDEPAPEVQTEPRLQTFRRHHHKSLRAVIKKLKKIPLELISPCRKVS